MQLSMLANKQQKCPFKSEVKDFPFFPSAVKVIIQALCVFRKVSVLLWNSPSRPPQCVLIVL